MKNFFICLLVTFSFQISHCQSNEDLRELKNEITTLLNSTQGNFAVAFKDIESNDEILIGEREEFHAASTMKTPVMIEVFKQAEQGKFSLSDSVIVKNEFKSIVDGSTYSLDISRDSADKLYSHIGEKSSIEDLMIGMIIHSSNLATNNIVELIDAKKANQTMRELGAKDIMVLRGVEDIKAYEAGLSNTTTAYDLMLIYEKLAKGEVVSEEASQRMTEILLRQQHNDIIPALLPEEVKVAHKTGSITGVRHDSGMVILPDGRKYVLVLLSEDIKDSEAGIKVLAQVSRMVYDYMAGKEE